VSFADLPIIPLFGLTVNAKAAPPVPCVEEGVSQLALESAVHAQSGLVTTLTSPSPPAAGMLAYVGDTP
jgi:hypothetical protein